MYDVNAEFVCGGVFRVVIQTARPAFGSLPFSRLSVIVMPIRFAYIAIVLHQNY